MPELPEVETTCRGIEPHIDGQMITGVTIRNGQLRWPVPRNLNSLLAHKKILSVSRRAKYILISIETGTVIIHLGMSGSLRIVSEETKPEKHDHVDIKLSTGQCLRLRDPRRFGAVLFTKDDPGQHKLLSHLGPEPLDNNFNSDYLFERSRKKTVTIKQFIMDSKIVVGVGNIYASEALFLAGIYPKKAAGKVTRSKYEQLVKSVKQVLKAAIKAGGTSLRDFTQSDGKPGYFQQTLNVYQQEGEPCNECQTTIKKLVLGQRATFYCPKCQKC